MEHQSEDTTGNFPQICIVSPPVKAMRVPVQKDPAQGNNVIAYLKSGSMVTVLSKSTLWLRIQLPNNQQGFIQLSHARPATDDEMSQMQPEPSPTAGNRISPVQQPAILSTTAGLTDRPPRKTSARWIGAGLLPLSFVLCILGDYLVQGIQVCYVSLLLAGCTNPYAPLGNVLIVSGFIIGGVGTVMFVVALVRAAQRH